MTKMKKPKIKILAILISTFYFLTSGLAAAATLSLSPANVSVIRGQTFIMTVALNPQGAANYTVKVKLNYPVALLEVQSFTFASAWLPLTQSGYDLIDNTNGVLIKTAGYPGGISSLASFGTVSFRAKATGSGSVSISSDSAAYDSGSRNVLTGLPVLASVAVSAPAATPVPTLTPTILTPTAPTPTPEAGEVEEEETIVLEQEQGFNFFAAIEGILTLGTDRVWVAALLIVAILSLACYLINSFRKRKLK